MGSGFNFFTSRIDKTPATAGSWQDVNVSGDGVPEGATGVVLELYNSSTTAYKIDVRKKGSTDDEYDSQQLNNYISMVTVIVGIDSNRKFQAKIENTSLKIYLIGYCDSAITFFDNKIDKSTGTTGQWVDVDLSANIPADATGAITRFVMRASGADVAMAVRRGESGDNFVKEVFGYNCKGFIYCLCGVDANRKIQQYIGSTNADLYLVGYTKAPVTFHQNAQDVSLTTIDAWTDDDVTSQTASDADGAIIEVVNVATGTGVEWFDTRPNGTTWGYTGECKRQGHAYALVKLDPNQIFEGYIDTTDVDFKLIGYCKPAGGILKEVTDSASLSESILRNKTLTIADSMDLGDLILGDKQFSISDAIGVSELITVITEIVKQVTDSLTVSDAVGLNKTLVLADQVQLTENIYLSKILVVSDQIALVEIVEKAIARAVKTRVFLVLGDVAVQLTGD